MAKSGNDVMERPTEDIKLANYDKYNVYMMNDNTTTFDFVIEVLIKLFHKSSNDAEAMAYKVHTEGQAFVGAYSKKRAYSKVHQAKVKASESGFTDFTMRIEKQ